jgi:hypothetical protein
VKKKKHERTTFKDAESYSDKAGELGAVCEVLRKVISGIMPRNSGRIYNNMPVWFLEENPAVGYRASKTHVTLIFCSGRVFTTPGLTPEGSLEAAEIQYSNISDIHKKQLRNWLEESKTVIYDNKDTAGNKGTLRPL